MNILDKFSFRDVSDVTLYEIDKVTGDPTKPVLFLDTLKVSTIETTCEQVEAIGGQGQTALLTWDYGKDITVNITDALFSMKTLGTLNGASVLESNGHLVRQGLQFIGPNIPRVFTGPNGKNFFIPADRIIYNQFHQVVSDDQVQPFEQYIMCFTLASRQLQGIPIKATDFPSVYYMTGETLARDLKTNTDEFCQFIIPKVKIYSDFNLELSGRDPSVFSFRAKALSTSAKKMMSLVRYNIEVFPGDSLVDANNLDLYALDARLFARFK